MSFFLARSRSLVFPRSLLDGVHDGAISISDVVSSQVASTGYRVRRRACFRCNARLLATLSTTIKTHDNHPQQPSTTTDLLRPPSPGPSLRFVCTPRQLLFARMAAGVPVSLRTAPAWPSRPIIHATHPACASAGSPRASLDACTLPWPCSRGSSLHRATSVGVGGVLRRRGPHVLLQQVYLKCDYLFSTISR